MKILYLLLFFIAANICIDGAVIKGKVSDYESGLPLTAQIDVAPGMRYFANTNGDYRINSLDAGIYRLTISYPGYLPCADTINISHSGQIVELNINLTADTSQIEMPTEYHNIQLDFNPVIEEYHGKYKNLSSWSVLKIRIDSIALKDKTLYAYSTFTNQLRIPLYILKNSGASVFARGLALKDGKDTMMVFRSAGGYGSAKDPDMQDLLVIPPGGKRAYPPIALTDNFEEYLPGSYSIIVKYSYRRPLSVPYSRGKRKDDLRDQIYLYNMTLRGDYYSENSVIYENNSSKLESLDFKFLLEGKDSMQTKNLDK